MKDKQYVARLEMMLDFKTDGDPEEVINKLIDLFATIDTNPLRLTWDDCEWKTEEVEYFCDTCSNNYEVIAGDANGNSIGVPCPDCLDEE